MPINSFLYPGAKVVTPYEVANSLRFDDGSSDYLSRTPSSTSNRKTFTFSTWVKRSSLTNTEEIFYINNSSSDRSFIEIGGADSLLIQNKTSGTKNVELTTNRKFRDTSAWYHIVVSADTTQGTDSNRVKLYINGVQETSFSTETYPSQNTDFFVNNNVEHSIGRRIDNNSNFFNGYLAETVLIDGQQLDPTSFGEFDEDSPTIWKPKDVSGLTFGTNGFYLDFENSSALGNDVSGNDNDFTANNLAATDQSTDTCTNNFATFNSLDNLNSQFTFSEGNLTGAYSGSNGSGTGTTATFGLSQGKWYWEVKYDSANDTPLRIGITNRIAVGTGTTYRVGFGGDDFAFDQGDGKVYTDNEGGDTASYGSGFSVGDIIGVALDLDNNRIYWSVNGTYENSGNPAGNSNGFAITDPASIDNGFYFPVVSLISGSGVAQVSYNFGSPPFAISSGNSDANGYGNFEYSVPSGFYAINTKNLAEFG
jgi:hypothetical protein|tara:strand:+ start:353 stop:1789 length:1437 start_codon:yes stop_codon:yes gene_type:complete